MSARLVARYVIVEKLYLRYESEAALGLQETIGNLYATILTYLAKVKTYFTGGTLSKCSRKLHRWRSILLSIESLYSHTPQERLGRAFLETIGSEYAELLKKVSETEVEKWTRLVEEEREHVDLSMARPQTYGMIVHQRAREDVTEQDQMLKHTLAELKTPIVQMSDKISTIHDTFSSKDYPLYVPYSFMLISCQEKSGKWCSAGCRRSSIEATMTIFPRTYFLSPGNGYSIARTLLNGVNRVCLLFSGYTAYVRNHAVI